MLILRHGSAVMEGRLVSFRATHEGSREEPRARLIFGILKFFYIKSHGVTKYPNKEHTIYPSYSVPTLRAMPVFTGRLTVSKLPSHLVADENAQKYLHGGPQVKEQKGTAVVTTRKTEKEEKIQGGLVF
tara:strand:+ start:1692 stop:2078 length:387 start_codon:yes stop_codon:yes gene_type:complete